MRLCDTQSRLLARYTAMKRKKENGTARASVRSVTKRSVSRAEARAKEARQRLRMAKTRLKRARKQFKAAKRDAKRSRKQAAAALRAWKRTDRKTAKTRKPRRPPRKTSRLKKSGAAAVRTREPSRPRAAKRATALRQGVKTAPPPQRKVSTKRRARTVKATKGGSTKRSHRGIKRERPAPAMNASSQRNRVKRATAEIAPQPSATESPPAAIAVTDSRDPPVA